MSGDDPVPEPTDDIMCATYRALCRHGYADLTMQDIADEWSKSKPALHYHYDTKRGLLLAFLDHLYDAYTDRVAAPEEGSPRARLDALIDAALDPPRTDAHRELRTALFEVKAQAPHDEAFRERLERFDTHLADEIRRLVAEGVDAGAFRTDADPETAATLLVTLVNGAHSRRVALGADDGVRAAIDDFVADSLEADR
ncbi:TetR/AcrR family transcriptional regulator [Haloplanus halophilus]|uniref:TetR/AcrR family transcriptional regulator n=1 Tax=Haloplanus halophilus TaxID=2949993 RepID=UPI00203A681E|nr:TetR/AcrR family transcriptional regulator [Haloplanus sp. GDY1]